MAATLISCRQAGTACRAASWSQNQRERILAAVADVSSSASYAAMSVEDIIVTRRHLAPDVLRALQEQARAPSSPPTTRPPERLLAAVACRVRVRSAASVSRVRAGIEAFLVLLAADPAFARMCIVEVMAAGPEAVAATQRGDAGVRRDDRAGRERHCSTSGPPSALTAETVVGGIYDVIYNRIQQGLVRELPGLTPDLVYTAVLPYVGPEGARSAAGTLTPVAARTGPAAP